jgi:hypothetical protein
MTLLWAREMSAMERTRTATIALQNMVCLICCNISTPPVAAKFVGPWLWRNYSPEIPEAAPAAAAGDFPPLNQKLNLQPS